MIPEAVQRINSAAFAGTRISEVVIPSALVNLGPRYFSIKGLQKMTSLCCCGITSIPDACFSESSIESIKIPAKVLKIESQAFKDCHHLVNVRFEEGSCLQSIEDGAFSGTGISEIGLPDSLQLLGDEVFRGTSLVRVSIPFWIQKLGDKVFANCSRLKSLAFADGTAITKIEGRQSSKERMFMKSQSQTTLSSSMRPSCQTDAVFVFRRETGSLFVMIALSTALIARNLFAVSGASRLL